MNGPPGSPETAMPSADTQYGNDTEYSNTASGNARVGAQFGVFHGNFTLYQFSEGTPEEQFAIGLNNLRAGVVQEAQRLISGAYARGFRSSRVLFYYALSVMSGKPVNQIVQADYDKLDHIFQFRFDSPDEYSLGLDIVKDLIFGTIERDFKDLQEPAGSAPEWQATRPASMTAAPGLERLPAQLREDIERHLRSILESLTQDEFDAAEEAEIEAKRFSNGRRRRAILFFLPDPRPPVQRSVSNVNLTRDVLTPLIFAGLSIAVGLVVLFTALVFGGSVQAWLLLPVLLASTGGALWGATEILWLTEQQARAVRRYRNHDFVIPDPWHPSNPNPDVERFSRFLFDSYEQAFRSMAPRNAEARQRWELDTRGIRVTLTNETVLTYGEHDLNAPDQLEWLVFYQVKELRRRWDDDGFREVDRAPKAAASRYLGLYGGGLVCAISALLILVSLLVAEPGRVILGCLLVGAGIRWGQAKAIKAYLDWRCFAWEKAEAVEQYANEQVGYRARLEFLRDRPSDLEMAYWLEYDLRYMKREALKEYGLNSRDLISHLILTEAAPGCWRARVPGGPPRYSEYSVQMFLLTENGVRQLVRELGFLTGHLGSQHRLNFRYDALSSAAVDEVGVRFAGRRRKVVLLRQDHDTEHDQDGSADELVFSQSFRLTLVGGNVSDVLIENYKLWADELGSEDQARLMELAMETSGVRTALHVLEAVAAEGRDWIRQERNRYLKVLHRRSQRANETRAIELPSSPAELEGRQRRP